MPNKHEELPWTAELQTSLSEAPKDLGRYASEAEAMQSCQQHANAVSHPSSVLDWISGPGLRSSTAKQFARTYRVRRND